MKLKITTTETIEFPEGTEPEDVLELIRNPDLDEDADDEDDGDEDEDEDGDEANG